MNYYKNFDFVKARQLIKMALKEDIGSGDVTTDTLIPKTNVTKANLLIKEKGIIAGLKIFEEAVKLVDKKVNIKFLKKDGDYVKKGDIAAEIKGNTGSILKVERTALNILQRMSGTATQVYRLKEKLNNDSIKIIDTRKTIPNFRLFDKLAVKIGGGANHRFGLYDMMLIKDNHIEASGGISKTIEKIKKIKKKKGIDIEIEVKSLSELNLVLKAPKQLFKRVLLDNFSINDARKAVQMIQGRLEIEVSGNISLDNISKYKNFSGVDYISTGAITHSVKSMDISLDFIT